MRSVSQRLSIIYLLVVVFVLTSSLLIGCAPTKLSESETKTIGVGQYWSIPITLKSGDLIEGSFVVSGPTNLDIIFSIQSPTGSNVFGPVKVRGQSFTYKANADGIYHILLDNTYSWFDSKIVTLSVTYPKR